MCIKKIFGILFLGCCFNLFAQLEQSKTYGFNVGFVSALGTHQQRFGVVIQGYYVYEFAQINTSFRIYDNFKDLGPEGEHPELNAALGLCMGYGKQTATKNVFVSSIGNQTGYKNSLSYSYNVWYNKIKTSQVTGIVALQFNHFSVIIENDLLAKPYFDRFRTGAFLLQYQDKQFQYALNCTMWTGQLGQVIKEDVSYPYYGYLNTIGGTYSHLSHGLLSIQLKYANDYGQYLQANAGVDAEQIRNTVQNRMIHDVAFIPHKWFTSTNAHIPMIDAKGDQYLYKSGQKIKKPQFFLNGYTSPNVFY